MPVPPAREDASTEGRGPTYTVRVLERVAEIPQATWDSLVSAEASPFVEHTWLDALEETGCVGRKTGWQPAHLSLWRGDALVAVAPAYFKGNSEGEFVFDWNWADFAERIGVAYYPKLVVAVPFTPATGDRVLVARGEDRAEATRTMAAAARQLCAQTRASGVHVLFPREEEASTWESSGYLRREGFQYHWFREDATTFDGYLARFSSKHRNQIKREIRQVHDAGVDVEVLAPEGHTRELARKMHAFYETTIDKHGPWGRLYLNDAFFERIVERFRHRLAWVIARDRKSGEAVGGAFNVTKENRLYGRYWGAQVDVPCLHFVACYYAGVRYCVERGLDVFEPGAGGEHKRVRGFVPTLTRSTHWLANARLRTALTPWLEQERARVRSIVTAGGEDAMTES
jgi:predicted N-acyltransferase